MREAWREPWQPLEPRGLQQGAQSAEGQTQMLPLTAVAARLGIGVFASGPLSQAGLLRDSGLMVRLLLVLYVLQICCCWLQSCISRR